MSREEETKIGPPGSVAGEDVLGGPLAEGEERSIYNRTNRMDNTG